MTDPEGWLLSNKHKITLLARMWVNVDPCARLWKVRWCSCCGKQCNAPHKLKTEWPYDPEIYSWVYAPILENKHANRYLNIHVHSSIICNSNSQKVEATQVFNKWMDKQNMVLEYSGTEILLSPLKTSNMCSNMVEHYDEWDKPFTKQEIMNDSTYWGVPSSQIQRQEVE